MECNALGLFPMREVPLHVQHPAECLGHGWQPESPRSSDPVIISWELAWSQQQPLKQGYKTDQVRQV